MMERGVKESTLASYTGGLDMIMRLSMRMNELMLRLIV